MERAFLGGSVPSIWGGDQEKAGDPFLEGDYKEDKGAFLVPSQLWELALLVQAGCHMPL